MPEEREAFSRLLGWGLTDIYRRVFPETQQFTWWGYMGGAIWKNEGMRIDYALATAPLLERIGEIGVDLWPRKRRSPTPSDHAPLVLTLDEAKHE
jgi:exodeoxyribonuclease-3